MVYVGAPLKSQSSKYGSWELELELVTGGWVVCDDADDTTVIEEDFEAQTALLPNLILGTVLPFLLMMSWWTAAARATSTNWKATITDVGFILWFTVLYFLSFSVFLYSFLVAKHRNSSCRKKLFAALGKLPNWVATMVTLKINRMRKLPFWVTRMVCLCMGGREWTSLIRCDQAMVVVSKNAKVYWYQVNDEININLELIVAGSGVLSLLSVATGILSMDSVSIGARNVNGCSSEDGDEQVSD